MVAGVGVDVRWGRMARGLALLLLWLLRQVVNMAVRIEHRSPLLLLVRQSPSATAIPHRLQIPCRSTGCERKASLRRKVNHTLTQR